MSSVIVTMKTTPTPSTRYHFKLRPPNDYSKLPCPCPFILNTFEFIHLLNTLSSQFGIHFFSLYIPVLWPELKTLYKEWVSRQCTYLVQLPFCNECTSIVKKGRCTVFPNHIYTVKCFSLWIWNGARLIWFDTKEY